MVLEQLPVTFSLIQSLLTFIIVTFPHAGLPVSTVVNEMRGPLLRYSPSTCGHVKHLVSVMLHCCVLPALPALSHYPNHSQVRLAHKSLFNNSPPIVLDVSTFLVKYCSLFLSKVCRNQQPSEEVKIVAEVRGDCVVMQS